MPDEKKSFINKISKPTADISEYACQNKRCRNLRVTSCWNVITVWEESLVTKYLLLQLTFTVVYSLQWKQLFGISFKTIEGFVLSKFFRRHKECQYCKKTKQKQTNIVRQTLKAMQLLKVLWDQRIFSRLKRWDINILRIFTCLNNYQHINLSYGSKMNLFKTVWWSKAVRPPIYFCCIQLLIKA